MNAIRIDSDLKKYFDENKKCHLTVHSVFKEAINLIDTNGELITLLAHNKDIGPMGLIVSPTSKNFCKIIPSELVEKRASTLYFKSSKVILNFSNASEWEKKLTIDQTDDSREETLEKSRKLRQILVERGEANGLLPLIVTLESQMGLEDVHLAISNNTYSEFIQDVFIDIIKLLKQKRYDDIVTLLPKFIGFGPGLTPSTDDFLSGVILAERAECLSEKTSMHEIELFGQNVYKYACGRTTKVSESMLKHVSNGKASESHMQLIEAIYSNEKEAIEPYAIRVLMNGATSGSDFILGVYCSLLLGKHY